MLDVVIIDIFFLYPSKPTQLGFIREPSGLFMVLTVMPLNAAFTGAYHTALKLLNS